MSKVLIAGGCGFIGHKVAIEFIRANFEVFVVDNWNTYNALSVHELEDMYRKRRNMIKDAVVLQKNVCDQATTKTIFEQIRPDLVVHLANFPTASLAVDQPFFAIEQVLKSTLSLLEAARSIEVGRFVYISSSMVYGNFKTASIKEDHEIGPTEPYGIYKAAAEGVVRAYTRLYKMDHSIVRPIAVYGPTGHETFVITRFVRATKESGVLVIKGKDTALSFTYVDDVAQGIFRASILPQATNATFNIGSGYPTRLVDVASYLKGINPKVRISIEEPDPLYPKRGTLDITKARDMIGYEPRYSIEEGLAIVYESMQY